MADVFISYARSDREKVEKLAAALQGEGWSVWWDRQIVGGAEFSKDIERELTAAKVAIVAWSKASVDSRWVRDEAVAGAEAGKLVPVSIDGAPAPMGFRQFHTIELGGWQSDATAPAFQEVARAVRGLLTGTAPAAIPAAKASWAKRLMKPLPLAALGAAMLALIGVVFLQSMRPAPSPRTEVGEPSHEIVSAASIAVLPFADLSPAGDQQYFSEGIAEEILNVLAKVTGLQVASRTSSFQFRNRAVGIPLIARELGVRHILEGSIRKAGDTVRITAQLIDAQTDAHLWSQTFDRPLTIGTIFAIQDEIAKAIVSQLTSSIGGTAPPRAALTSDTDNLDAYDLYLKGRDLFINRNAERLGEAARILKKSTAEDAKFARAWEMLAAVYVVSSQWGLTQEQDYAALALEAADKALSLNPDLSMPYAVRGITESRLVPRGGTAGWEVALASFSQALARDPKNTTAMLWRGITYQSLGYFGLTLADMAKCLEIDPAYEICRRFMAVTHVLAGRIDEGLLVYEQGLEKGYLNNDALFAAVYRARGDRAAARALLVLAYPKKPHWVRPIFRSLIDPTFTEVDRKDAIALLDETEVDARFFLRDYAGMPTVDDQSAVWWWRFDPAFLKSEARKKLIRQWRLPDYWRKHGFPPQCKPVGADDFECN